jgi:hypothetical protein
MSHEVLFRSVYVDVGDDTQIVIRCADDSTSPEALGSADQRAASMGHDLWPAAALLCAFLQRVRRSEWAGLALGDSVIELGAGTGLVGLMAARGAGRVDVTDGDPYVVAALRETIAAHHSESACCIRALYIDWSQPSSYADAGPYDSVVASDITFLESAPPRVLACIASLLRVGGLAFIAHVERFAWNTATSQQETEDALVAMLRGAARGLELVWEHRVQEQAGDRDGVLVFVFRRL